MSIDIQMLLSFFLTIYIIQIMFVVLFLYYRFYKYKKQLYIGLIPFYFIALGLIFMYKRIKELK